MASYDLIQEWKNLYENKQSLGYKSQNKIRKLHGYPNCIGFRGLQLHSLRAPGDPR
jgi:hypothetical protein